MATICRILAKRLGHCIRSNRWQVCCAFAKVYSHEQNAPLRDVWPMCIYTVSRKTDPYD